MNYINIKTIMDRITRHPLLQDIPFETVVDYAVDLMKIIGAPPEFIDKTAVVDIHNYRGELPCDFYEMIQVRLLNPKHHWDYNHKDVVFRYSTDSFHMSRDKKPSDLTYKLQGNCIFTSPFEHGPIEIAYKAILVDEDGYPMLPDKSSFLKALEAYIKKQWFTIQFDLGKINPQIMQKADQDYAWAVGQAQSDFIRPSIDQLQSISAMWNTLLVRSQEHRNGFRTLGATEHVKVK